MAMAVPPGPDGADHLAGDGEIETAAPGRRQEQYGVEEMDDERMHVLKMLEQGKVNADEAAKLLSALDAPAKPAQPPVAGRAQWLRIRVTDGATGRARVNVNVPLGVVTAVGRLGTRFGLDRVMEKEGVDLESLIEAVRSGAAGKLVDVTDEEKGEHVEIFVE